MECRASRSEVLGRHASCKDPLRRPHERFTRQLPRVITNMTTLLSSIAVHTLSPKSAVAKCARWALAAAIGGLAIGSSGHANAQEILIAPDKQPDLTVAVSAPPVTQAYEIVALSMTANNLMPTRDVAYRKIPSDQVVVTMDLAGFEPLFVQAPAGFTCQFGARYDANFYYVTCHGSLKWGSNATFEVWAEPQVTCGTPAYTDAAAWYTAGQVDANLANNRAITRSDFEICIN
jgi:hypothetical protein